MNTKYNKYSKYKDSGVEWLGEIPEGWDIKRFKFISKIQKGKLPKKIVSENNSELAPYMSMEYLRGGEENQWVIDNDAIIIDKDEILVNYAMGSISNHLFVSRYQLYIPDKKLLGDELKFLLEQEKINGDN